MMTDRRLAATRHARVVTPLIAVTALVSLASLLSGALITQQIRGIAVIILSVAVTAYCLDYVIRLVGIGDDRLALLSPLSRWRLLVVHCGALGALLCVEYVAIDIPSVRGGHLLPRLIFFACYVTSALTGLGLMAVLTYAAKPLRSRSALRLTAWGAFLLTEVGVVGITVGIIAHRAGLRQWVLGASTGGHVVNAYAAIVPISVLDVPDATSFALVCGGANLLLGFALWAIAWLLCRHRRNNYAEL